jgi:hypothetical protein
MYRLTLSFPVPLPLSPITVCVFLYRAELGFYLFTRLPHLVAAFDVPGTRLVAPPTPDYFGPLPRTAASSSSSSSSSTVSSVSASTSSSSSAAAAASAPVSSSSSSNRRSPAEQALTERTQRVDALLLRFSAHAPSLAFQRALAQRLSAVAVEAGELRRRREAREAH